tara:strand:+ start:240 stop:398 length:159 start_codon:yes stop_codon:yes gene_type:complete
MKITKEMVEYWYGGTCVVPKDVLRDIVDIANGDYKVETLRNDIKETWSVHND